MSKAKRPNEFFKQCSDILREGGGDVSIRGLSDQMDIPERTMRDGLARVGYKHSDSTILEKMANSDDEDLKEAMAKMVANKQKSQDILRVERKYFRQKSRLVNGLEEYASELKLVFQKKNLSKKTVKHPEGQCEYEGIIQFSDLHINERISLSNNEFDVKIASQRIQKHVCNAKKMFKAYGIKNVVVAFTGDLLNSNRRLDELLMNATNRANATFVAVDILQQALLDLNQDFNLRCANVTGNESRIEKDIGWINDIAQDNFDFVIFNTLAYLFKGSDGVVFEGPDDTYLEKVVNINSQKILLIHGHNGFARDTDKKMASKIGQYAQKGQYINYVLCGHIHSAQVSDLYARSSGLPGSNGYSQNALDLAGRSSQNIYMIGSNGDIHGVKVDLQDYAGYDGYQVKNLDIYDQKL